MSIREVNFKLTPGDSYVGMCAKVFITRKGRMVFHCTLCYKCTFGNWQELLDHIAFQHEVRCIFKEQDIGCSYDTPKADRNTLQQPFLSQVDTEVIKRSEEYEENYQKNDDDENLDNFEFCEVPLTNVVRNILAAQCEKRTPNLYDVLLQDDSGNDLEMDLCQPGNRRVRSEPRKTDFCQPGDKRVGIKTDKTEFCQPGDKRVRIKTDKTDFCQPGDRRVRIQKAKTQRKDFCETSGVGDEEKYTMDQHMQQQIGRRDFTCLQCDEIFMSAFQLKTHKERDHKLRDHNGPLRYRCTECGECFSMLDQLKMHMRRSHY